MSGTSGKHRGPRTVWPTKVLPWRWKHVDHKLEGRGHDAAPAPGSLPPGTTTTICGLCAAPIHKVKR